MKVSQGIAVRDSRPRATTKGAVTAL